jgi:hypothetical protein
MANIEMIGFFQILACAKYWLFANFDLLTPVEAKDHIGTHIGPVYLFCHDLQFDTQTLTLKLP